MESQSELRLESCNRWAERSRSRPRIARWLFPSSSQVDSDSLISGDCSRPRYALLRAPPTRDKPLRALEQTAST